MYRPESTTRVTPAEIIETTKRSDEYLQVKNEASARSYGATALWSTGNVASEAMYRVGERIESEHPQNRPEAQLYKYLSFMPDYIKSERQLELNRRRMSKQEYDDNLENVINMNHVIREIIDEETFDTMSDMLNYAQKYLLQSRLPRDMIKYGEKKLKQVIDGMRHEVAAQSALTKVAGVVEVRESKTVAEEQEGVDLTVEFADGTTLDLDIKSTPYNANKANNDRLSHTHAIIWSGFEWDDFNAQLIPDNNTINSKTEYFSQVINNIKKTQPHLIKQPTLVS